MSFPLMPFFSPQLRDYSVTYLGYIDTSSASSGTMNIGTPDANRWLLFTHARSSSGSLTTNGVPVSVDGSPSTMLFDRTASYASDGQHIKLMMKKWPSGTSATMSNLQTGGGRGSRLLVFSVYGAQTLIGGTTYFGGGTITVASGSARSINLLGYAGNSGSGFTVGNFSAVSETLSVMGGVTLNATGSETYTASQLVTGVKITVS